MAKVVEKCLAPDAPISVQDACVRGLLYLSEDIGSQVLPLLGPALTKYLPSHLQLCSRSVLHTWQLSKLTEASVGGVRVRADLCL